MPIARRAAASILTALALAVASPLPAQQPDTLRLPLRWEITETSHAVAESLGVLTGIAVDRNGTVYVSDRGASKIWVFDSLGRSQRGIGRKGQGPGEFQSPTGIAVGPDGRLWVRDIERVSRFTLDRATGRLTQYEAGFAGPTMADWMNDRASRFMVDGGMTYPEFGVMYRQQPPPRAGRWFVYGADGALRDSIDAPWMANMPQSTARVQVSARSGRMVRGLNHVPFAAIPVWDVTPRGTVLVGDGRTYVIREIDRAGKLVREFKRSVAPERISAAERRDSTTVLRARIDSLQWPKERVEGVPPDVWALKLPETYPPYMAVYSGLDGRIWLRRWVANGRSQSVFDVFETDGRFRAVVVLPREIAVSPTPALSLDGIAALGVDRETGAFTILRFGRGVR